MEARNRYLPDWITRIRTHQIELPRFQRMEAWGNREITDLLQTVVRGLPAGSVLILEVGDKSPFISRPMEGAPNHGERVTELLLDGQQRLTALWRSLTDNYEDRVYFAEFPSNDSQDTESQIVSVGRWQRNGKRYPVWADSAKACWERRYIPVRLFGPDDQAEAEMDKWVEEAVNGDPKEERALSRRITRLRQQFSIFNIPFLSLPVGTPRSVALDVFIKMNTRMVRLTAFDVIVAQTEETTGQSLHDLMESLLSQVPELRAYDETPEDTVLAVHALLQDRLPNQTGFFDINLRQMVDNWEEVVEGSQAAIEFLEEEHVFDYQRLPTEVVLPPLIALYSRAPSKPDARGNAKVWLRKYLWRAFFTDRYERAAASAAFQDYRGLRDLLAGRGTESNVPCFDEAKHSLPAKEALIQAGWPKKRDRLARAILLLSLRGGARDFAEDNSVNRDQLKKREYHHLYPLGFLRQTEIDEKDANRALNCALIGWRTNRAISAKRPVDYLLERSKASNLGEAEIRKRLATHAVSYNDLKEEDYEKFLANRAQTAMSAIEALCSGA